MAAVTGAGGGGKPRRKWLVGVVVGWIVVIVALGVWSVRKDPATVPDQRDIVAAVGDMQRAVGVVFAAAGGDARVAVLGRAELVRKCRVTPVRSGMSASRDVTVYVRDGEVRAALADIAEGLPAKYQAYVSDVRGGTRVSMHADAGEFVGVDTDAEATEKLLTLRITTGCRPRGDHDPQLTDPAAGAAPPVLDTVLRGLGGTSGSSVAQAVACADGGVAATWVVSAVAMPADFDGRMRTVSAGGTPVRGDDAAWAFRTGTDAVVVVPDGKQLRVSVSRSC